MKQVTVVQQVDYPIIVNKCLCKPSHNVVTTIISTHILPDSFKVFIPTSSLCQWHAVPAYQLFSEKKVVLGMREPKQ